MKFQASNVGISQGHARRQTARGKIQSIVEKSIEDGEVTNQTELEELLDDLEWALGAVRGVPFEKIRVDE